MTDPRRASDNGGLELEPSRSEVLACGTVEWHLCVLLMYKFIFFKRWWLGSGDAIISTHACFFVCQDQTSTLPNPVSRPRTWFDRSESNVAATLRAIRQVSALFVI